MRTAPQGFHKIFNTATSSRGSSMDLLGAVMHFLRLLPVPLGGMLVTRAQMEWIADMWQWYWLPDTLKIKN